MLLGFDQSEISGRKLVESISPERRPVLLGGSLGVTLDLFKKSELGVQFVIATGSALFFCSPQQFHCAPGRIVVASRGQLRVRQPKLPVISRLAAHRREFARRSLGGRLRSRPSPDPVIGHLLMGDVAGRRPRHMASNAIGILRMVLA